MAQISNSLGPVFYTVTHLSLQHEVHIQSSKDHNEVDRIEWRKLLRSFDNVKTLHIATGLVEELSRYLQLEARDLPSELLPEPQELTYFRNSNAGDVFTLFIDARQNAGRPVTLTRSEGSMDFAIFN